MWRNSDSHIKSLAARQVASACLTLLLVALFLVVSCARSTLTTNSAATRGFKMDLAELRVEMAKIEPFFKRMSIPGKDDWLWANKEPGQTFDEYIDSNPTMPTDERKIIYVQPLGRFTAEQIAIIKTTSDYLEAFYGLKVRSFSAKPLPNDLKEPDQRMIDYPKHRQIRTGYVMEKMLRPALPKDAAALIAFTNEDLYPDSSMYFVFGQASLENRVGIWSLFRLKDKTGYDAFLARTLKIAVHETGHMFSFLHCTKYECVMSGTNHLGETDSRPIDACPECMAKICWMLKEKPEERYKRLEQFARKYKLSAAEKDFQLKSKAVSA